MDNIEDKLEHLKDGIALQLTKINMNMINHSNLKDKIIIDKKYLEKNINMKLGKIQEKVDLLVETRGKCFNFGNKTFYNNWMYNDDAYYLFSLDGLRLSSKENKDEGLFSIVLLISLTIFSILFFKTIFSFALRASAYFKVVFTNLFLDINGSI